MGNKYIFNNATQETEGNGATIVTVTEKCNELASSENQVVPSSAAVEGLQKSEQNLWQMIFSWRGFIVLLLHAAYVIHSITHSTVPMALVCMCGPVVSPSSNVPSNTTSFFNTSGHSNFTGYENGLLLQDKKYEFDWDSKTRGFLLSGAFFTDFLAPVLASTLMGYLGNRVTLALLTMIGAALNFLSPITARANVYIFLAVRVLSGFFLNSHMPIAGDTMAWWLPVSEKLTSVSFVIAGWYVAGSLGPLISGYLCLIPFDGGWPLIFYFNGAVAVPWTIAWFLLSSPKPEDHPFISQKEKTYITMNRVGLSQETENSQTANRPPYRRIFSSIPVLSSIVSAVAVIFNSTILASCMPVYMASLLKYSLQEVGIIMCVTWGLRFPAAIAWSAFGNWLLRFESITLNGTRKICFFLGQTMACVFAVGISFCDQQYKWTASALILMCMASLTFGTSMTGLIPLDMAPRYAGFITSMTMSLAFLISLWGPIFVSIVTEKGTFEEWRLVWIIMGIVFFASGLQFTIFGSAKLQPWAVPVTEITTNLVKPSNIDTAKELVEPSNIDLTTERVEPSNIDTTTERVEPSNIDTTTERVEPSNIDLTTERVAPSNIDITTMANGVTKHPDNNGASGAINTEITKERVQPLNIETKTDRENLSNIQITTERVEPVSR